MNINIEVVVPYIKYYFLSDVRLMEKVGKGFAGKLAEGGESRLIGTDIVQSGEKDKVKPTVRFLLNAKLFASFLSLYYNQGSSTTLGKGNKRLFKLRLCHLKDQINIIDAGFTPCPEFQNKSIK